MNQAEEEAMEREPWRSPPRRRRRWPDWARQNADQAELEAKAQAKAM